jgi:hypothetical protein
VVGKRSGDVLRMRFYDDGLVTEKWKNDGAGWFFLHLFLF